MHADEHKALYTTIGAIFAKFEPLLSKAIEQPVQGHCQVLWCSVAPAMLTSAPLTPCPVTTLAYTVVSCSVWCRVLRAQVIVKAANIVLEPHTEYGGGVWHLEGMAHEQIVATGIFYYDQENVADNKLAFRRTMDDPDYEQGDAEGEASHALLGLVLCVASGLVLSVPNCAVRCVNIDPPRKASCSSTG